MMTTHNDDHSPPTSSDVKNEWHYTCIAPYYAFKARTGTALPFMTGNFTSNGSCTTLLYVQTTANEQR